MVAEGVFMSKLIYLIEVWGGCENYLMNSLQILQNKVARLVTRRGMRTPISHLLHECGWLSVRQLMVYHTVSLLHKTRVTQSPKYLHDMYEFDKEPQRYTRLGDLKLVKSSNSITPNTEVTRSGFKWKSIQYYNLLPLSIRCVEDVIRFKKLVKSWTIENIPVC